jgi:hypothetical protein
MMLLLLSIGEEEEEEEHRREVDAFVREKDPKKGATNSLSSSSHFHVPGPWQNKCM